MENSNKNSDDRRTAEELIRQLAGSQAAHNALREELERRNMHCAAGLIREQELKDETHKLKIEHSNRRHQLSLANETIKRLESESEEVCLVIRKIDKILGVTSYELSATVDAVKALVKSNEGSVIPAVKYTELHAKYHGLIVKYQEILKDALDLKLDKLQNENSLEIHN